MITLAGLLGVARSAAPGARRPPARSTSRSTRRSSQFAQQQFLPVRAGVCRSRSSRAGALRAGALRRGARRTARRALGARRCSRRSGRAPPRCSCSSIVAALVPQPATAASACMFADLRRRSSCSCDLAAAADAVGPRRSSPSAATSRPRAAPASASTASTSRCSSLCSTFAALGGILAAAPAGGGEPEQRRRRHQPQRHRGRGDRRDEPVRRPGLGATSALLGILVIHSISNGLDLLSRRLDRQASWSPARCCSSPSSSTA